MAGRPDAAVTPLLTAFDEAFERRSWHGPNLRGAIRGLTPLQASWRPAPRRHNVWEIVVHAAYWKYVVWRKLTDARRGSFPIEGSNWFTRPAAERRDAARAWAGDIALLVQQHRQLREEIAGLDDRQLHRRLAPGSPTAAFLIRGIVAHDLYHAGQIQLIKRLRA